MSMPTMKNRKTTVVSTDEKENRTPSAGVKQENKASFPFGHNLAILMQNMAIFMLYLASKAGNSHVLHQNRQKIGDFFSIFGNCL